MKNFTKEDLYKAWLKCSVLHPEQSPLYAEIIKELEVIQTSLDSEKE